jgi:hypothetical protein
MRWLAEMDGHRLFFSHSGPAVCSGTCRRSAPLGDAMWSKLVKGYRQVVRDQPGCRFQHAFERWHQSSRSPVLGVLIVLTGVLLIAAGLALSLVPGIPGIILGIPGLVLIATRSRRLAAGLDWVEIRIRGVFDRFRRQRTTN